MFGYGIEDVAQAAYKDVNDRADDIDGYKYLPSLSNRDMAVYGLPNSVKTRVAFRGTSKTSDIIPDIGIATNTFSSTKRYQDSKEALQKIVDRVGKDNIHLSGHSLGAATASKLGSELGIRTDSYNTGSTPLQLEGDLLKNIGCRLMPNNSYCRNSKLVTNHIVRTDPISIWNLFSPQNNVFYKATESNPHSLQNFLD